VEYARVFWDKACSDNYVCLDKTAVARCTGKPGVPFVPVASGTRFDVKAGSPPTEEVLSPFGKLGLGAGCLDDATHFVSCCIGTPPKPAFPLSTAIGGGFKVPTAATYPKAPYGVTDATALAALLERDPDVRTLVKKSSDRHLPPLVRNGDVIVYWRGGRYTHAAIFAKVPNIATHSVSRSPEGHLVSAAWDFVLDLDPSFAWSIYHLPVPLKKFAVSIGPFPAKLDVEFDTAGSAVLQLAVGVKGTNTLATAKAAGARSADTLAGSLIDLTGAPAKPAHASFFDGETFYVGSLGKLFAMFAAYELRNRVRRIVEKAIDGGLDSTKSNWERPVIAAIGQAWKTPVAKGFAGLDTSFPGQFPELATIFEYGNFAPGAHVRFRQGGATPDEVNAIGEFKRPTPNMAFDEWIDLMIRFSNNFAAGRVITALRYPYINGVLREAGFQSPTRPKTGPLFISGSYDNHDWTSTDLGQLGARGTKHYKSTTNFVGNALEVARLLTTVATRKAFGGDAQGQAECDDMMTHLKHGPGIVGNVSFIRNALEISHHGMPALSGKIGISDPPLTGPSKPQGLHDCAIVERTAPDGTKLRYVMVVLGGYNGEANRFGALIRALDDCIGP